MKEDRRNARRWNLLLFLPVSEVESNEVLGYIADISEEGILVFSPTPIELDQTFSLVIRLPDLKEASLDENISDERILFQATSRWVDSDAKPFFNRTGLVFVDLSPEVREILDQIIRNVADNLAWNKVPSL
jgi:c-di-GMP-binding flagellar brake protein YcgR